MNMSGLGKTIAVKAALTGALNAGLTMFLTGGGSVAFFGQNLNVGIPLFISGGAGSAIADVFSEQVLKMIPGNMDYLKLENALVGTALCAGGNIAVLKIGTNIDNSALIPSALIAGGSYLGADYGTKYLLTNAQGQLIF